MLARITPFLKPPIFEDEEKTRIARMLHVILWTMIGILVTINALSIILSLFFDQEPPNLLVSLIATGIFLGLNLFVRLGFVRSVSFLFTLAITGIITLQLTLSDDFNHGTKSGYMLAIILAGLLLGGRSALLMVILNLFILGGIVYFTNQGTLAAIPISTNEFITYGAIFTVSALLLTLASRSIRDALAQARTNEQLQLEANQKLMALQNSLESQVSARTRELFLAAEISQRLAQVRDLDAL
ncbi:MAG: hypothetical protein HC806_00735 [Anaerolineae bacterium]|nr:hypothetical protein [Anaerolineae bacterium]